MLLPTSGTILVVDDRIAVRRTIRRTLEYYGHTVLEAGSGREGLLTFNEEQRRIDLVLLSSDLSDAPCEKILSILRKLNPGVKVALLTDQAASELKGREDLGELVGILRKPVSTDRLLAVVRKGLER